MDFNVTMMSIQRPIPRLTNDFVTVHAFMKVPRFNPRVIDHTSTTFPRRIDNFRHFLSGLITLKTSSSRSGRTTRDQNSYGINGSAVSVI